MGETVEVSFSVPSATPTSFALLAGLSLPPSDPTVICLEFGSKKIFLSAASACSSRDRDARPVLALNGKLGRLVGLREGDSVLLRPVPGGERRRIRAATITCACLQDWEILESETAAVTEKLLHQIRVLYPSLEFPFWITRGLQINLRVERLELFGADPSAEPEQESLFGVLTDESEIHVVVPERRRIKDFEVGVKKEEASTLVKLKPHFRLRLHPLPRGSGALAEGTAKFLFSQPRNAFILRDALASLVAEGIGDLQGLDFPSFSVELLQGPGDDGEPGKVSRIPCKIFILEECGLDKKMIQELFYPPTTPPALFLSPQLMRECDLEVGQSALLRLASEWEESSGGEAVPLHLPTIAHVGRENEGTSSSRLYPVFHPALQSCLTFLHASLSLGNVSHNGVGVRNGSLLLEGKAGSGKTRICQELLKRTSLSPYFVHQELISCSKWRGKKPESIEKEMQAVLERCCKLQPALLVLDDLDLITPTDVQERENLQEQFLHLKTCETIRESLLSCASEKIAVLGTATSLGALNPYWRSRQGFHFFQHVVSLPPLTLPERLHVFYLTLTKYGVHVPESCQSDVEDTLGKVHVQLSTHRLVSNVAKKTASQLVAQNEEGQNKFYAVFQASLKLELKLIEGEDWRGKRVAAAASLPPTWNDVQGLHKVKNELVKILRWPIKYKRFFQTCPIRLPSGILLYGYPGTGKTLLGLAIPSLVNTEFIHIKGPELLSKYIGASEQAVQDVFKRAKNSSPCVLFFDEFDSLVPRRGHDSTGVTDRVVNQFLAEMDGVEGGLGNGVYLVGATSRPDLIDPAILRPGRLDKHLFFDLPNETERSEIFSFLGAKVNLQMTEGMIEDLRLRMDGLSLSGADIQSLICSAQMVAVQEFLNHKHSDSDFILNSSLSQSDIPVSLDHVIQALSSFRPSLQPEDLERFRRLYSAFAPELSSDGEGTERARRKGKKVEGVRPGSRATLA